MTITVTFKTPDAAEPAIKEIPDVDARDKAREKLGHWIKYGEYITIAFDLDAMTAKVRTYA